MGYVAEYLDILKTNVKIIDLSSKEKAKKRVKSI